MGITTIRAKKDWCYIGSSIKTMDGNLPRPKRTTDRLLILMMVGAGYVLLLLFFQALHFGDGEGKVGDPPSGTLLRAGEQIMELRDTYTLARGVGWYNTVTWSTCSTWSNDVDARWCDGRSQCLAEYDGTTGGHGSPTTSGQLIHQVCAVYECTELNEYDQRVFMMRRSIDCKYYHKLSTVCGDACVVTAEVEMCLAWYMLGSVITLRNMYVLLKQAEEYWCTTLPVIIHAVVTMNIDTALFVYCYRKTESGWYTGSVGDTDDASLNYMSDNGSIWLVEGPPRTLISRDTYDHTGSTRRCGQTESSRCMSVTEGVTSMTITIYRQGPQNGGDGKYLGSSQNGDIVSDDDPLRQPCSSQNIIFCGKDYTFGYLSESEMCIYGIRDYGLELTNLHDEKSDTNYSEFIILPDDGEP